MKQQSEEIEIIKPEARTNQSYIFTKEAFKAVLGKKEKADKVVNETTEIQVEKKVDENVPNIPSWLKDLHN